MRKHLKKRPKKQADLDGAQEQSREDYLTEKLMAADLRQQKSDAALAQLQAELKQEKHYRSELFDKWDRLQHDYRELKKQQKQTSLAVKSLGAALVSVAAFGDESQEYDPCPF